MEKNKGRRGAFKSLGHIYIASYRVPQGIFFFYLFNQFCIFTKISDQLPRFSAVMFL